MKLRKEWEQTKSTKYQGVNLYVKNIEDEVDEERLKKEFSAFGNVVSHKIASEDGKSKGFGFVCFGSPEEAMRAISEMHGRVLGGCSKPLYVALHEPLEQRRAKLAGQRHSAKPATRPGQPQPTTVPFNATIFYPPTSFPYPQPIPMGPPLQRPWPQPFPQGPLPGYPVARGGQVRRNPNSGNRGGQVPRQKRIVVDPSEPLNLQILSQMPYEQQKLLIGEKLYPLVAQVKGEQAGKITGMFLDSGWSIEELLSLLSNEAKLNEKIEEAMGVLEKAAEQQKD